MSPPPPGGGGVLGESRVLLNTGRLLRGSCPLLGAAGFRARPSALWLVSSRRLHRRPFVSGPHNGQPSQVGLGQPHLAGRRAKAGWILPHEVACSREG